MTRVLIILATTVNVKYLPRGLYSSQQTSQQTSPLF